MRPVQRRPRPRAHPGLRVRDVLTGIRTSHRRPAVRPGVLPWLLHRPVHAPQRYLQRRSHLLRAAGAANLRSAAGTCRPGDRCPTGQHPGFEATDCPGDCCVSDSSCVSNGCPANTCGWQIDNCNTSIYCGQCEAPACNHDGACAPVSRTVATAPEIARADQASSANVPSAWYRRPVVVMGSALRLRGLWMVPATARAPTASSAKAASAGPPPSCGDGICTPDFEDCAMVPARLPVRRRPRVPRWPMRGTAAPLWRWDLRSRRRGLWMVPARLPVRRRARVQREPVRPVRSAAALPDECLAGSH